MQIENLMVKQFVPQKLLLANDKVKVFVTHCGCNSVAESLYYNGTPMYGLPLSAD